MPGGSKANNRDLAAIALATGKTSAEAGTAAGVSERTVTNWLRDAEFAARVKELRGGMVAAAAGRLTDGMSEAASVIRALLASDSEGIRLRAADRLIELGLKVAEVAELQRRVDEIEALLKAREATP